MSNRIQLKRSSEVGKVPALADLLVGELAFNSADNKLYINDGSAVRLINSSAYLVTNNSALTVTSTQIATWDAKQDALGYTPVNVAGDTMSGALILAGTPTLANEAATKKYVDDQDALKLSLAGGTMTGALVLAADPVANLEPTTKQYVDGAVSNLSGKYAAPVQNLTDLTALAIVALEDKQIRLVEDSGAIYRYDVQSVVAVDADGVVAPDAITPPAAGRWIKVQAATQNHNMLNGLQGGAANDFLHLTTAEKNGYDSHIVDASLHLTSSQNTWLDAINASSSEVNYLVGVTSAIQTQLNGKEASLGFTPVNIAGDTMTGLLILSGDPVAANGAATKNYIDTALIDGGVF